MTERKQDALTEKFLDSLIENNQIQDEKEEITLELKTAPEVDDDESFSNLASRIVDEVISSRTPADLAKRVLSQAGINTGDGPAEPQVFNGHLRHVGKRARKIARKENTNLRIRRVKTQSRGAPPSLRRRGAPPETRTRPSIGMEDEVRRSARESNNRRGKSRKKSRRLFRR
tara:strand:- start:948 stop:1463 length:516 start_codon:yes stop_codon:yes gene_type:complete